MYTGHQNLTAMPHSEAFKEMYLTLILLPWEIYFMEGSREHSLHRLHKKILQEYRSQYSKQVKEYYLPGYNAV
jgi:hypothetical protein